MRFRKKPIEVEAIQWDGANANEVLGFVLTGASVRRKGLHELVIETLDGEMTVSRGDWIIKGIKGEFYPCKPDIFAASYDPVER